jgi:predicted site-specific integrase-resolvase
MTDQPKLITIRQAADMLGVTPLTLRNWDKNGKFKALRHPMNNYRVYRREDVEKIISEIKEDTKPVQRLIKNKKVKLQVKHLEQ